MAKLEVKKFKISAELLITSGHALKLKKKFAYQLLSASFSCCTDFVSSLACDGLVSLCRTHDGMQKWAEYNYTNDGCNMPFCISTYAEL